MLNFVINNYLLIVILVGLIILLHNSLNTLDARKKNRVRELMIVVIFLTVSGSFKNHYSSLDYYTIWNTITHFIAYTLRPAIIILFISVLTDKKNVKYLSLLCIINSIIYVIGLFNGMTFSFSASNELIRGSFGYTSHVFCLFYFLVLLYLVIRQYSRQNRIKTIVLLSIMIMCAFASYFDLVYDQVNLFDIVMLMCGLEYYIYLYIEHSIKDVLTNTYNRAYFYSDVKKLGNKVSSVISIDMNDLKKINDTLGHDEGDKAIVTIAKILLNVDDKNVRIYRVGGDEFVALCFYKEREKVNDYIKKAKKELSKTKYNCSFGYAYKDINDLYEVYKMADNEMYKEKEEYHKKNGKYR